MTPDQRDQLLDLHREAMREAEAIGANGGDPSQLANADDAFRAFLFSLDVTR